MANADGFETYLGLRSQVLGLDPSSVGLSPSPDHPWVWGVLMDMDVSGGCATLVALVDGTTSLYTSSGGGTIGAGAHRKVAEATDRLVRVAERWLGVFPLAAELDLPAADQVRITAFGYSDVRSVVALETDLGDRRHPAASVFHAAHGVISEIRLLDDRQPNRAEYRQPDGTTLLMAAAFEGRTDVIAGVLDAGYRVDEADDIGQTALIYAANGGRSEAIALLLSAGARVDVLDRQGNDALMFAAQHGHIEILRALLAAGANPSTRGVHGLTALGLARQNGHAHAAELLVDSGAVG